MKKRLGRPPITLNTHIGKYKPSTKRNQARLDLRLCRPTSFSDTITIRSRKYPRNSLDGKMENLTKTIFVTWTNDGRNGRACDRSTKRRGMILGTRILKRG